MTRDINNKRKNRRRNQQQQYPINSDFNPQVFQPPNHHSTNTQQAPQWLMRQSWDVPDGEFGVRTNQNEKGNFYRDENENDDSCSSEDEVEVLSGPFPFIPYQHHDLFDDHEQQQQQHYFGNENDSMNSQFYEVEEEGDYEGNQIESIDDDHQPQTTTTTKNQTNHARKQALDRVRKRRKEERKRKEDEKTEDERKRRQKFEERDQRIADFIKRQQELDESAKKRDLIKRQREEEELFHQEMGVQQEEEDEDYPFSSSSSSSSSNSLTTTSTTMNSCLIPQPSSSSSNYPQVPFSDSTPSIENDLPFENTSSQDDDLLSKQTPSNQQPKKNHQKAEEEEIVSLRVVVKEVANLPELIGGSHPYVVLEVGDVSAQTSTQQDTTHPQFNEAFDFLFPASLGVDVADCSLGLKIMSKGEVLSDEVLAHSYHHPPILLSPFLTQGKSLSIPLSSETQREEDDDDENNQPFSEGPLILLDIYPLKI